MVRTICKYYLRFPPIARTAINFSLTGFINYAGIDYSYPGTETILLECDDMISKKLFV